MLRVEEHMLDYCVGKMNCVIQPRSHENRLVELSCSFNVFNPITYSISYINKTHYLLKLPTMARKAIYRFFPKITTNLPLTIQSSLLSVF